MRYTIILWFLTSIVAGYIFRDEPLIVKLASFVIGSVPFLLIFALCAIYKLSAEVEELKGKVYSLESKDVMESIDRVGRHLHRGD